MGPYWIAVGSSGGRRLETRSTVGVPEPAADGAVPPAPTRSVCGGTRTRTRELIGLAVLGSLLALPACSGGESSAEPASPSPTVPDSRPSPTTTAGTSDPEDEAAAQAAMAAYRELNELVQDARRDPSQDWLPAYTQLAADPYRSTELLEISALRDRGIAHSGAVTNASATRRPRTTPWPRSRVATPHAERVWVLQRPAPRHRDGHNDDASAESAAPATPQAPGWPPL